MQIIINAEDYAGYSRFLPIQELDAKNLHKAKSKFEQYQICGVITTGAFEDVEWVVTNEVKNYRLRFAFDEEEFERTTSIWMGCTASCFQDCVKAYIVFLLGDFSLASIYTVSRELIKLAGKTADEAAMPSKSHYHIIPFLGLLPSSNESLDSVIECLEETVLLTPWENKQRRLSNFRNYLRFHEVMKNFWMNTDDEKRIHFFPLYLWWNLTAILPLRATEFLLLPRDCLKEENGRYILSIRRTRMKKKGNRQIKYRIDTDYEIREYEIPGEMAIAIKAYQKATEQDKISSLGTMFIPNSKSKATYLNYRQMNTLLRQFCIEVIGEPDFQIHLGDTRHLAMINLILSGGSPVICRELAGHEDINVSSGYYTNLSSIVDCVVYEHFHRGTGETRLEGSLYFPISLPQERVQVKDGWCDAPGFKDGCITECLKSYGKSGMLGDCRNCTHFYPDKKGMQLEILTERKRVIDADGIFLMQMIELVRHGNGCAEDIGAALLRLQASSHRYGAALCQKYN